MATCYLLHFDPPFKHARHYLGFANFVKKRVAHHRNGTGANLTKHASKAGCKLIVARTWKNATRETERLLKHAGHHSRLCPMCNPDSHSRGKIRNGNERIKQSRDAHGRFKLARRPTTKIAA